ncbi:hypothetical protein CP556_10780 [Natrinema sp. CBA1119]|uniref:hypothetical protein n=1 Tax=Natrinema sp. CBA1119 TaxID=1608465 RepID=UPI000BF9EE96|nr:hypothetical protein [Natrinema sp. CBA1119]PGF16555.1 hypothetical protein CP556_10780 [Natrinema sp. CBA1119]
MSNYTAEIPDEEERGIRIECDDHGEWEEFRPGYRTVDSHCDGCGLEIQLDLRDLHDWRDLGELC